MTPETKINRQISESGYDITPLTNEQRERLAQNLTHEEADVLLNHGTEAPFCGNLTDNKEEGVERRKSDIILIPSIIFFLFPVPPNAFPNFESFLPFHPNV